jgi:hypothetical protein
MVVPVVPDRATAVATHTVASRTVSHKPASAKPKKKAKADKPALLGTAKGTTGFQRAADDPSIATGGARAPDAPASTATPVPTATPIPGQPTEPIANGPQPTPEPATAQSGTPPVQGTGAAPTPVPTATP